MLQGWVAETEGFPALASVPTLPYPGMHVLPWRLYSHVWTEFSVHPTQHFPIRYSSALLGLPPQCRMEDLQYLPIHNLYMPGTGNCGMLEALKRSSCQCSNQGPSCT